MDQRKTSLELFWASGLGGAVAGAWGCPPWAGRSGAGVGPRGHDFGGFGAMKLGCRVAGREMGN